MIYNRNIVKLLGKRGFGGNAPNKLKAYAEGGGASLRVTHAVGMAKSLSIDKCPELMYCLHPSSEPIKIYQQWLKDRYSTPYLLLPLLQGDCTRIRYSPEYSPLSQP